MKAVMRKSKQGVREPRGSAALVVGVIALVLGLAGGALAAKKYVITSTGQIKPSVLKKLKGAVGPAGPQGSPGAAGQNGLPGAAGKDGSNGKDGTSVTTSTFAGAKGSCTGGGVEVKSASPTALVCNGNTGFTEVLPSGMTETGVWSLEHVAEFEPESGARFVNSPNSFSIPLAEGLEGSQVHLILQNGKEFTSSFAEVDSTACTGSVAAPTAEPGSLCVYSASPLRSPATLEEDAFIAPTTGIQDPATGALGTGTAGFLLQALIEKDATIEVHGTWAVTAP